jgi:hypothetical protein
VSVIASAPSLHVTYLAACPNASANHPKPDPTPSSRPIPDEFCRATGAGGGSEEWPVGRHISSVTSLRRMQVAVLPLVASGAVGAVALARRRPAVGRGRGYRALVLAGCSKGFRGMGLLSMPQARGFGPARPEPVSRYRRRGGRPAGTSVSRVVSSRPRSVSR